MSRRGEQENGGVIYVEDKGWYWYYKGDRLDAKFYKRKSAAQGKLAEHEIALNKAAEQKRKAQAKLEDDAEAYANKIAGTYEAWQAKHDKARDEWLAKHAETETA